MRYIFLSIVSEMDIKSQKKKPHKKLPEAMISDKTVDTEKAIIFFAFKP